MFALYKYKTVLIFCQKMTQEILKHNQNFWVFCPIKGAPPVRPCLKKRSDHMGHVLITYLKYSLRPVYFICQFDLTSVTSIQYRISTKTPVTIWTERRRTKMQPIEMATFFLGLATFFLGMATFILGMATFF